MSRDPVIEELRALPEPPLPEAVWQRLDARRARRVAMRRSGVLSACVLAGGLAFVGFMPRGDEAIAPTALPPPGSSLGRTLTGSSLRIGPFPATCASSHFQTAGVSCASVGSTSPMPPSGRLTSCALNR